VAVENGYGDVELRPGGAALELTVTAYALGTDLEDARVRASDLSVKTTEEEGRLSIAVVGIRDCSEVRADLVLSVPASLPVELNVDPGAVSLIDLAAPATVQSPRVSARMCEVESRRPGLPSGSSEYKALS